MISSVYKIIFTLLDRKQKFKYIYCNSLQIVNSLLEIFGIAMLIPMLDFLINYKNKNYIYLKYLNINSDLINEWSFIFLFLIIFFFILKTFIHFKILTYQRKFITDLQFFFSNRIFKKFIFSNYKDVIKTDVVHKFRIIEDVGQVIKLFESSIVLNSRILSLITISLFLLFYDLYLTTVAVLSLLFLCFLYLLFTQKYIYYSGLQRRRQSSELMRDILNGLNSLKELIIQKKQIYFYSLFKKNNLNLIKLDEKNSILGFIPRLFGELFLIILAFIILIFIFVNNEDPSLGLIKIAIFVAASTRLLPIITSGIQAFQTINNSLAASLVIKKEFLESSFIDTGLISDMNRLKFRKDIKISKIYFSYDSSNRIFSDLNLTINKSKVVGLIGESGSGKTTFINILLGFLKPNRGNIFLDSKDIYLNISEWHNIIAYVPQDIFLLNKSIAENIAFGNDKKDINKEKIKKIIKICGLNDLISKKINKLNFLIGERGNKLSGGQRQRLGIARALYKNPEVLFLDETTSSLDLDNEAKILKNIRRNYKDLTIIVSTHRINTLKNICDLIVRVENKNIRIISKNSL